MYAVFLLLPVIMYVLQTTWFRSSLGTSVGYNLECLAISILNPEPTKSLVWLDIFAFGAYTADDLRMILVAHNSKGYCYRTAL